MTYIPDTLRLLIAHDSQDEAEQLINALRNAGRATRAQLALNEDDLVQALKGGTWEIMLCRPRFGDGTVETALGHIRRLGKVLPVVLISDDYNVDVVENAYRAGARAVAPQGNRDLLMLSIDQLTDSLRLRRELQDSEIIRHELEKRLSQAVGESRDAIAYVVDGMYILANRSYAEMFGYQNGDELAGVPLMDMISTDSHDQLKELLRVDSDQKSGELNCQGVDTEGRSFDTTLLFSPSSYDGEACTQIVVRTEDISEGLFRERLQEISQTDTVTGLYNRCWFMEEMDRTVERASRHGQLAAVLYLRLDNFDQHQSSLGIDGADAVLRAVADWLHEHCGDASLARVDGEDYAVMKPVGDLDEAAAFADQLREGVAGLMPEVAGRTVHVTASVGVAFVREDAHSGQRVLTQALKCCNQAQRQNEGSGNAVKVHDPMDEVAAGSVEAVALSLRQALKEDGFQLFYQPLLSLAGDDEQVFEVFVHLPQKQGDDLTAADFMAVAVDQGLAGKVDRWVVLQALRAAAAKDGAVRLLINLCGHSLGEPGFASWLAKAIQAAGLSGRQLIFQISEADAVTHLKQAANFARNMGKLGCGLSISHFGGGLDPFKLFEHIPATMVKFERSFTQDLDKPEACERFAEIIEQAREGERGILVGFVESAAQMQTLWTLGGVDYLQGYYLQEPMAQLELAETAR